MHVMATSHAAPVLADGGLLDAPGIIALAAAAFGGGGVAKLLETLMGRRRLHADAAEVVTGAMTEVMTAAIELLKPQTEQLVAIQERHRIDLQALRDEHSASMARVQTEHGAAMERLGSRIEGMEQELRDLRAENSELKGRLAGTGHITGEIAVVKSVDSPDA